MDKLYEDLMTLPAVSGNEKAVRNYMHNYMKNYQNFTVKMDNLGSIFAVKKAKKFMK